MRPGVLPRLHEDEPDAVVGQFCRGPLRVAQLVPDTLAEGPGRRFAVWVQGCTIRCAECCNPQMFTKAGGEEIEAAELAARVIATPEIEGISFLGGEPMQQPEGVLEVATHVKEAGLSVMIFSGYTLVEPNAGPMLIPTQFSYVGISMQSFLSYVVIIHHAQDIYTVESSRFG